MNNTVLFIVGPTASGKSKIAMTVARQFHGEIISADSMQVYKGMDIGTAKPSAADRKKIPHHLIDVISPTKIFSAYHYRNLSFKKMKEIIGRKKLPIVVGGTGLYVRALLEGWVGGKPLAELGYSPIVIGIDKERSRLYADIEKRVDQMFRKGWVKEVKRLSRHKLSKTASPALGYREIAQALAGEVDMGEARLLIKKRTRNYAKRQMTWFRKEKGIIWAEAESAIETIKGIVIAGVAKQSAFRSRLPRRPSGSSQ